MQIKARIELDADDVAQAIHNYVREKTGHDIVGSFKAERERGGAAYSVPSAYDIDGAPKASTGA